MLSEQTEKKLIDIVLKKENTYSAKQNELPGFT